MIMDTSKHNFVIEVSVKKDGKIIVLNADDMKINIYQKCNGEQKRILEIECCEHPKSLHTSVERIAGSGIYYNAGVNGISMLSDKEE
jgi:hypothetical protein